MNQRPPSDLSYADLVSEYYAMPRHQLEPARTAALREEIQRRAALTGGK